MGLVFASFILGGDLPVSHVWRGEFYHHVSVLKWGLKLVDVNDGPVVVLYGSNSGDWLVIEVNRVCQHTRNQYLDQSRRLVLQPVLSECICHTLVRARLALGLR